LLLKLGKERATLLDSPCPDDRLVQIAKSFVPTHFHDLITCLASEHSLAYVEDLVSAPPGSRVGDLVEIAIRERLISVARSWFEGVDAFENGVTDFDALKRQPEPAPRLEPALTQGKLWEARNLAELLAIVDPDQALHWKARADELATQWIQTDKEGS